MKKKILSILIILLCIFTVGCEEKKEKELEKNLSDSIDIDDNGASLVCTTDMDYTEYDYTLGSKYVVFADNDGKVTKIVSSEIINSNDKSKLDEFEEYLNKNHEVASKYNGYKYDIKKESKKVISSVSIDYSEFDLKTFIKDNNITNMDEVLTLDSVEKQYVSLGAECNRK